MGITIIVNDDPKLTESEVDEQADALANFVGAELKGALENTNLSPYLVEALSGAAVLNRRTMSPTQTENIELLRRVETRGRSCDACAYYHTLLLMVTCLGTRDEYYGLRRLMELHDLGECWSTTFLHGDSSLTATGRTAPLL